MSDTFDKIVDAISPARILGTKKPKARKAAGANTDATRRKHLSGIRKNLAKLTKDIERLAAMVAGRASAAKPSAAKASKRPAAKRSARSSTKRPPRRAARAKT